MSVFVWVRPSSMKTDMSAPANGSIKRNGLKKYRALLNGYTINESYLCLILNDTFHFRSPACWVEQGLGWEWGAGLMTWPTNTPWP